MNSRERVWAAIDGTGSRPPVVIPYLQYYFPGVVEELTPFTERDLLDGSDEVKVDALSALHEYFDCDWVRATVDLHDARSRFGERMIRPSGDPISAEELLDSGLFDVAIEITRRFKGSKFVYGRVAIPYAALFGDWSDIEGALIALRKDPAGVLRLMEESISQRLEEIRAWQMIGVDGLWLGQWMCSADMVSEADYLKFIYPTDPVIIDAVRDAGLVGIYHFCGDVVPRLKYIRQHTPTVFGVEEPKKGFEIDIADVRAGMGDDVCLLGNIDVYGVVEKGMPETWAREVERQVRSGGPRRFIVSCGSPITPDTSPGRLRDFIRTAQHVCDTF